MELRDLVLIEDEATYDVESLWRPRPIDDFLRVPFGVNSIGDLVSLDLKDSALGGMGPHGLCIGATGSGRSELLRTLTLVLAMTHPPERLNLILIDERSQFHFEKLKELPHVSAYAFDFFFESSSVVDRLRDIIHREITHRQKILQEAGQVPNITEYNRLRDAGAPLPPLPNLLILINHFASILENVPDFLDLLLTICRSSRQLGLHLLPSDSHYFDFATSDYTMHRLERFLSYRIVLRTFTPAESELLLGVPDAHNLYNSPGKGYLKFGTTVFRRFEEIVYVSSPYRPATGTRSLHDSDEESWLLSPSIMEVVLGRLIKAGTTHLASYAIKEDLAG